MKGRHVTKTAMALACAGVLALGGAGLAVAAVPQEALAATPAKVTIASVKGGPYRITVKVKKAKGAKGYQYRLIADADGDVTNRKSAKTSVTCKVDEAGYYYVSARAWGKTGKKTKWGKWSAVKRCYAIEDNGLTELVEAFEAKPSKKAWAALFDRWNQSEKAHRKIARAGYQRCLAAAQEEGWAWCESTPGWDLDYAYKLKIVNKVRSGQMVKIFMETDAPADYMEKVRVYVGEDGDGGESYSVHASAYSRHNNMDIADLYADLHPFERISVDEAAGRGFQALHVTNWVKVGGGYVTFVRGLGADRKTEANMYVARVPEGVQYQGMDSYYQEYPPHRLVGRFFVYPDPKNSGEYDAMLDDIIARAVTDKLASKGDQMQEVVDWVMAHSRYPDEMPIDGTYTVNGKIYLKHSNGTDLFSDPYEQRYTLNVDRYAAGVKMVLNSATGPDVIKDIGKRMGYPVEYASMTPSSVKRPAGYTASSDMHWWVCNIADQRWYSCCPDIDPEYLWYSFDEVPAFDASTISDWYTILG